MRDVLDFLLLCLGMRRDPNEARSMIDDDAALREMSDCGLGLVVRDHDDRGALRRVRGTTHGESLGAYALDQHLRESRIAVADPVDADLIDDLLCAERCVHGAECRRGRLAAAPILAATEA